MIRETINDHDQTRIPLDARAFKTQDCTQFLHEQTPVMKISDLKSLLNRVADGDLSTEDALSHIGASEDDLAFARVDLDRKTRCGTPEVIYCPGKTPDQVAAVVSSLLAAG